ncbi:hypothetical protein [Novosphingobium lindaniclasticum]|uniref:hypothetical protein n=1 Tax=Novosphingobium lindaniclasticum TaxID=1329895 RepID=UPI00240A2117|nr:hypothetical protein [Novosphingobium lindaniclasticum]
MTGPIVAAFFITMPGDVPAIVPTIVMSTADVVMAFRSFGAVMPAIAPLRTGRRRDPDAACHHGDGDGDFQQFHFGLL